MKDHQLIHVPGTGVEGSVKLRQSPLRGGVRLWPISRGPRCVKSTMEYKQMCGNIRRLLSHLHGHAHRVASPSPTTPGLQWMDATCAWPNEAGMIIRSIEAQRGQSFAGQARASDHGEGDCQKKISRGLSARHIEAMVDGLRSCLLGRDGKEPKC